jgi:hypothetical protein
MDVQVTAKMEEMRREINKRRTKLEAMAEAEMGLPTPWRPSRGRPTKSECALILF